MSLFDKIRDKMIGFHLILGILSVFISTLIRGFFLSPQTFAGAPPPRLWCRTMKVFVIYDAPDAPPSLHHKLAITLPAKWLDQSVEKVLVAFLGAYNKKFPDNVLVASDLVMSVKEPSPFARR